MFERIRHGGSLTWWRHGGTYQCSVGLYSELPIDLVMKIKPWMNIVFFQNQISSRPTLKPTTIITSLLDMTTRNKDLCFGNIIWKFSSVFALHFVPFFTISN